ncbi:MAG: transposase [Eggerthellaceae bacterium]|nr:transposase [Eggerthellaceae bacterium]
MASSTLIRYSKEEKFRLVKEALSSGMSIRKWSHLNHICADNIYRWIKEFRQQEPSLFEYPVTSGEWIELSREAIKNQSALALIPDQSSKPKAHEGYANAFAGGEGPCVQAEVNGVRLIFPSGVAETDLSVIFRAARS